MARAPEQRFYDPRGINTCTDAFYRFIVDYEKIIGLFMFTVTNAAQIDRARAVAAHALADTEERAKDVEHFNEKVMSTRIREYRYLI